MAMKELAFRCRLLYSSLLGYTGTSFRPPPYCIFHNQSSPRWV